MKKRVILLFGFLFVFVIGILEGLYVFPMFFGKNEECKNENKSKVDNVDIKYNDGEEYYIITGDYTGEYDYQNVDLSEYYDNYEEGFDKIKVFNTTDVISYDEYSKYCDRWKLKQKYNDVNKNYMIVSYVSYDVENADARIANVTFKGEKVILYMWDDVSGVSSGINGYFMAIPVDSNIYASEIKNTYTMEEYNNIINYGSKYNPGEHIDYKPIIYIYPESEMNVSVKLLNSSLLSVTYPKYNDGWNVLASENGNLKDLDTGKNYYGLYYEGINHNVSVMEDGFVIEGKDTVSFLEEKLSILGLNEREMNEFIIYWLPKLEKNKYNYIRFETMEEIEEYMPLLINPKPDSIIRILMDFKPLNEKINVIEQKLTSVKRSGYSVVEWGGSEIK